MRLGVAGLVLCGLARPAAAQLCHVGDVEDATEHAASSHGHHGHTHDASPKTHVQTMVTTEAATLEDGNYQGATLALGVHRDRFGLRVAMPYWRLDRLDTPYHGIGDVIVQAHARITGDARRSVGAVMAMGFPTGKASYGLGMGHLMVMPAVWGTLARGRVRGLVLLGAGKSLGEAHDHPGLPNGPPVSPMAPFEADATVRVSYLPTRGLAVDAIGALAIPLGDDRDPRAATGLGARWRRDHWQLGATGLVGVVGDPFGVRAVVDVGYAF